MPNGFGILFALFIGIPLRIGDDVRTPPGFKATPLDLILSLILFTAFFYGVGWIVGFALKKIRADWKQP